MLFHLILKSLLYALYCCLLLLELYIRHSEDQPSYVSILKLLTNILSSYSAEQWLACNLTKTLRICLALNEFDFRPIYDLLGRNPHHAAQ